MKILRNLEKTVNKINREILFDSFYWVIFCTYQKGMTNLNKK